MTDVTGKVKRSNADRNVVDSLLIIFGMTYNNPKLTAKVSSFCLHFLITFSATDKYRRCILCRDSKIAYHGHDLQILST
jgi:hypothetical protein